METKNKEPYLPYSQNANATRGYDSKFLFLHLSKGLSKGCRIRCRSYTNYFEGATQVHGQVWPFFEFQIEWLLHDFLQLI